MKSPIKRKARKSFKPSTQEEELLKENDYLRAENELQKKLSALSNQEKAKAIMGLRYKHDLATLLNCMQRSINPMRIKPKTLV